MTLFLFMERFLLVDHLKCLHNFVFSCRPFPIRETVQLSSIFGGPRYFKNFFHNLFSHIYFALIQHYIETGNCAKIIHTLLLAK